MHRKHPMRTGATATTDRPTAPATILGLLAWVLLAIPGLGHAKGPLPEHWISPESDWVVHVDAERLGQAPALRPIFDAIAASALGADLAAIGIDPRMDVTSITMFGTISRGPDSRRETTTMLQGGTSLQSAIQRHIATHQGHALVLRRALQAEGRGILAWTIDSLSVHVALVPMHRNGQTEEPQFAAVLSDNSDQLQTSISLLLREKTNQDHAQSGQDPSAIQQSEPARHRLGTLIVPEGTVVFACAKDLDEAHPSLSSGLLASADSLLAHLGYRTDADATVVFGGLSVRGDHADDGPKMAEDLSKIVEFWAAQTTRLSEQQPAMFEMLALVRACRISHEGSSVQVTMERKLLDNTKIKHEPNDGADRLAKDATKTDRKGR